MVTMLAKELLGSRKSTSSLGCQEAVDNTGDRLNAQWTLFSQGWWLPVPPPESLNPTHPLPIPPCRSSIPSVTPGRRRHRPLGRSRPRSYHPCPPLPYNVELGVHFTSVQGDIKSNISEPYHCQHPSFPPSLPSIPKDPWTNVVHAPSIQNNSLSLSARRAREMYTHQQKPLSLPIHPSIHMIPLSPPTLSSVSYPRSPTQSSSSNIFPSSPPKHARRFCTVPPPS